MSGNSERRTQPIAALAIPGTARLTLIAGPAHAGATYTIAAGETLAIGGASAQIDLSSDPSVAATQATFSNHGAQAVLRDDAANGNIFVRRRGVAAVDPDSVFMIGTERVRLVPADDDVEHRDADGTLLFTSPLRPGKWTVQQILADGRIGAAANATDHAIVIGAEGADLVLSHASSVSGVHAQLLQEADGSLSLADNDSMNGVYTPLRAEETLEHGDLFWIGRQLFLLDITA